MAGYSVTDFTNNLMLDMSLNAFTEFQPQLQIDIRNRPMKGGGMQAPQASIPVLVYQLPHLLANINNPMESAVLQINNNGNTGNVGRMANDFVIVNNNGTVKVTLNDNQWSDTYNYVKQMYDNASLIKEIGRNVRMHIINVLREIGLDNPVNGRFRATNFYDYRIDQSLRGGNNNNNFSTGDGASPSGAMHNGFSNNGRMPNQPASMPQMVNSAGISNSAPSIGMPSGMAMPSVPMNTQPNGINSLPSGNNTISEGAPPNMGSPMPPIPNPSIGGNGSPSNSSPASLSSGIQDMLNNAFSNMN